MQEQYDAYNNTVAQLVRYIGLTGMFELKDGQEYSIYKNITVDPFTWKQYNASKNLRYNKHGMMEIVLDTNDAVLYGSDQSVDKMKEVINRF